MAGIDLGPAFAAFLVEGRELAEALEQGLLALEAGADRADAETVNALSEDTLRDALASITRAK